RRAGAEPIEPRILTHRLVTPHPERLTYLRYALAQGMTVKELNKMTGIDPWFLYQLKEITDALVELGKHTSISNELLREAKRMGKGIEFDYCCCHAAFALHEDGYEAIMVNCNPETVSTDYDTSDRLYFEPLTFEDVLAVYEHEAQSGAPVGVIVQLGGQTPLNLALPLRAAGVTIIGTSPESIDLAEDRKRFGKLLEELDIRQPAGSLATNVEEAVAGARRVQYPVKEAVEYSQERPVLIDHFLESATEVDVDA